MTVTLTNSSVASIKVMSVTLNEANTSDSTETDTCRSKIAGNSSCTIAVTFMPQASGARSGTPTIDDGDPASPQMVALTGTGT